MNVLYWLTLWKYWI